VVNNQVASVNEIGIFLLGETQERRLKMRAKVGTEAWAELRVITYDDADAHSVDE